MATPLTGDGGGGGREGVGGTVARGCGVSSGGVVGADVASLAVRL